MANHQHKDTALAPNFFQPMQLVCPITPGGERSPPDRLSRPTQMAGIKILAAL